MERLKKIIVEALTFWLFPKARRERARDCLSDRLGIGQSERPAYGQRYIYKGQTASDLIAAGLAGGQPFLATRMGRSEETPIRSFLSYRGMAPGYPEKAGVNLCKYAGFFPNTTDALTRFCYEYAEAARAADLMGVWYYNGEPEICARYCPAATLIFGGITGDGALLLPRPWTRVLAGRKVLVISPLADSITRQYEKRRLIWPDNPDILPDFTLRTLKAVQSIADAKDDLPYASWFEALADMERQIAAVDFDVALISAGAYGQPLGAFVKGLGKQAVVVGGGLQIMFGIKGARWEESPDFSPLFNEHWVSPSAAERPRGLEKVERGCYW
ncbi:hypothetical protein FACS1894186_2010 [Alphaproteobacteria bacterium]|nr:hypothetical protein FACS1894186_2010 [Alphaproteobacteria bacterium]